jgi:hypothetical protein
LLWKSLGLSANTRSIITCRRAKRVIGFVLRNSVGFKNPKTVVTLYSSLARSLLEYASQVWAPSTKTRIKQLETVQHRFLRSMARRFFNDGGFDLDYSQYERKLNLHPLELRRIISDVNLVVKSFSGRIDSSTFLHHFYFKVPRLVSRFHQVFNPCRTATTFARLMTNFNTYSNDCDILSRTFCVKCTKAMIESKFVRISLNVAT